MKSRWADGTWPAASGCGRLIPPQPGDFNVPTPIDAGGKLIVATENNGARLYEFEAGGRIKTSPTAAYGDLSPDSSTPVLLGGRLFGSCNTLCCLDVAAKLNVLWTGEDDVFSSYASLIAAPGRVLVTTNHGELLLINASADAVRNRIALTSLSEGERGAFAPGDRRQPNLHSRHGEDRMCRSRRPVKPADSVFRSHDDASGDNAGHAP